MLAGPCRPASTSWIACSLGAAAETMALHALLGTWRFIGQCEVTCPAQGEEEGKWGDWCPAVGHLTKEAIQGLVRAGG